MTGKEAGIRRPGGTGDPRLAQGGGCWRWIYFAFFFLLPVQAVAASHSVVVLLIASALLGALAVWRAEASRSKAAIWPGIDRGLALGLGTLVAWSAATALWGLDPPHALLLSLRIALLFAAALVLHAVLRGTGAATRDRFGPCLIAGICAALAIIAFELLLDFPLGHLTRGAAKLGSDGSVWLNRGASALAILCWPAAGYLWRRRTKWAAIALLAAMAAFLSILSSMAAGLGFLAGAVVALAALNRPRLGRPLLVFATLAAMIASPIAAHQFHKYDLQGASWIPFSAQHRVEIWHSTLELIAERPLTGWGFDAARSIGRAAEGVEASGRATAFLHPHNAPLQILLELGPVGAAIILTLCWMLIQRIERLPQEDRPFGQAAYAATLLIACTAYGLWQNQWLALMACAAIAVAALAGNAGKK